MGYTHYWKNPTDISDEAWISIIADVTQMINHLPAEVVLAGGLGVGEPILNNDEICFNGYEAEAYEAFRLGRNANKINFCKTEYRPYDVAVCATLLIARHHHPAPEVSSDGEVTGPDWQPARMLLMEMGFPLDAESATKTPAEIADLKAQWEADGGWDIEDTPGFEAHHDELKVYRLEVQTERHIRRLEERINRANALGCSPAMIDKLDRIDRTIMDLESRIDRMQS